MKTIGIEKESIEKALTLLSDILKSKNKRIAFAVCGGSALILKNLTTRTVTKDIDIIGFVETEKTGIVSIISAKPLPDYLVEIVEDVSRRMNLPNNWLNSEPSDLINAGLPEGFVERMERVEYGKSLTVYVIDRIDQIHFKLYAAVDSGPGRHLDDFLNLNPTEEEVEKASLWAMKQDVSEEFRIVLIDMLNKIGFKNVAERL